jgi:hypothetical protein
MREVAHPGCQFPVSKVIHEQFHPIAVRILVIHRSNCASLANKGHRLDGRYSRISLGQLKIGLIAQNRKAHLTNNVQKDTRISDKDWAKAEKITSFAGYPRVGLDATNEYGEAPRLERMRNVFTKSRCADGHQR